MHFIARTSLASVMSRAPTTPLSFEGLDFDSEFQRRCVISDVTKSTLRDIEAFRPRFVLLDFIDERFDLLEIDGAIVALSHDFQACGLGGTPWAQAGRRIARDSAEASQLWNDAACRFVQWIRRLGSVETVLHRAPWVTRAVQGDDVDGLPTVALDTVCQICVDRLVSVSRFGALTDEYYSVFKTLMQEAKTIQADPGNLLGALGHVWGLTPFHYAKSYYRDVGTKLRKLGMEI